jgi:hypothetical protein
MREYRPPSARGKEGTPFDALHEGVPSWMREPVQAWIRPFLRSYGPMGDVDIHSDWLRDLQNRLCLDPPLPWNTARNAIDAFEARMDEGGELALDVLDYSLGYLGEGDSYYREKRASELDRILKHGRSAWEVTTVDEEGNVALTRRSLGPVVEAIEDLKSDGERAAAHLTEAWKNLAGRTPNPDMAYFHTVQAVEAAAKPVVTPNDGLATLGRMIRAIEAKPGKWTFVLGDPDEILGPARLLWETHRRHGTDDREAPMGMSADEADAGVHLGLTLVRWFASGAFKRA